MKVSVGLDYTAFTNRGNMALPKKYNHFQTIALSLYNEDVERLDGIIKTLKEKGYTRANRSSLFRLMLKSLDVSKVRNSDFVNNRDVSGESLEVRSTLVRRTS